MILNNNDSGVRPSIRRAVPRVGASLALVATLFGAGAGQLVARADSPGASFDGASLPYIVCGIDTRLQSGGRQSILLSAGAGSAQIDPAAIGKTFRIHGRSVADCGAGDGFKGVADRAANIGSPTLPADLGWLDGDRAGPTDDEMQDVLCAGRMTQGCTMVVPIAAGSDVGQLRAVAWALMQVKTTGLDSHSATLLGDASGPHQ